MSILFFAIVKQYVENPFYSLCVVPKCVCGLSTIFFRTAKDTPQNPTARMIPSKIVFHAMRMDIIYIRFR